jgi:hypothetical protein
MSDTGARCALNKTEGPLSWSQGPHYGTLVGTVTGVSKAPWRRLAKRLYIVLRVESAVSLVDQISSGIAIRVDTRPLRYNTIDALGKNGNRARNGAGEQQERVTKRDTYKVRAGRAGRFRGRAGVRAGGYFGKTRAQGGRTARSDARRAGERQEGRQRKGAQREPVMGD